MSSAGEAHEQPSGREDGAPGYMQDRPDGSDGSNAAREPSDSVVVAISREMVRIYKEQFGRGPTSARTYWAGPDTVITLLEDTLTPAERNMARLGEHERLRETRTFFQYATVPGFCEPVERLTGRKVRGFISGIDTKIDGLSVEVFVLHPAGADEPSRADLEES